MKWQYGNLDLQKNSTSDHVSLDFSSKPEGCSQGENIWWEVSPHRLYSDYSSVPGCCLTHKWESGLFSSLFTPVVEFPALLCTYSYCPIELPRKWSHLPTKAGKGRGPTYSTSGLEIKPSVSPSPSSVSSPPTAGGQEARDNWSL